MLEKMPALSRFPAFFCENRVKNSLPPEKQYIRTAEVRVVSRFDSALNLHPPFDAASATLPVCGDAESE